jgi:hypothetical protein
VPDVVPTLRRPHRQILVKPLDRRSVPCSTARLSQCLGRDVEHGHVAEATREQLGRERRSTTADVDDGGIRFDADGVDQLQ